MSAVVCPTTWQNTRHDDRVGFVVEVEAHAPVADAQSPFVAVRELAGVAGSGVGDEVVQRIDDASLDRPVEAPQVAPRGWSDEVGPGLVCQARSRSRLSSSGSMASPRWYAPSASCAEPSSSGEEGSLSSGGLD